MRTNGMESELVDAVSAVEVDRQELSNSARKPTKTNLHSHFIVRSFLNQIPPDVTAKDSQIVNGKVN